MVIGDECSLMIHKYCKVCKTEKLYFPLSIESGICVNCRFKKGMIQ